MEIAPNGRFYINNYALLFVAFSVFEIITSSRIKKNAIYKGISLRLIWFAISPNTGGIKVEPT